MDEKFKISLINILQKIRENISNMKHENIKKNKQKYKVEKNIIIPVIYGFITNYPKTVA